MSEKKVYGTHSDTETKLNGTQLSPTAVQSSGGKKRNYKEEAESADSKKATFSSLQSEIEGYGFHWSMKSFIFQLLAIVCVSLGVGIFYDMEWWGLVIAAVVAAGCLPIIVKNQFKQLYQQKRFNDVDVYLHQMVYSFQKMAKVSVALEDTYKITNGELHDSIGKAINVLKTSASETVVEDALQIMEDEYPCDRVKTLHKYLISIEHRGGRYQTSLQVLLADFDRWVKRIYKNQQDVKQFKSESLIGILITFVIGGATILIQALMGGGDGTLSIQGISDDMSYQIGCAVFIPVCFLYYTFVQCHYKTDWLRSSRADDKIRKDYKLVFHTDVKKMQIGALPVAIVFAVIGGVVYFLVGGTIGTVVGIALVAVGAWTVFIPKLDQKAARGNLINDAYVGFSEWLRDVGLNLQEEPLQAAIEETIHSCPVVMEESLSTFMKAISKNPSAVEPYYEFMSEFGVMDIQSTVRTLYSIGDLDMDAADESINVLINRNYEMLDRHDELHAENAKATRNFGQYVPMLFVTVKICIDMLAMMTSLL